MTKLILDKNQIQKNYVKLVEGKNLTPQQRGFEFEKLIFSLLQNEGLEPRSGYKPEGEQIDGSFFWQGQTFLLEAKWVKDPLPASSIYTFKGKLDGKFHTTSGIYISVNGYSKDLEDALKFGKSLNVILFDKDDIPLLFNGDVTFTKMLKFKLRQAGDTGSIQVSYKLTEEAKNISSLEPTMLLDLTYLSTSQKKPLQIDDLLVFVEGKSDIPLIKNLLDPIKRDYSLSYRIESLNGAGNIRQLPSLLSIYGVHSRTKALIVILDDDQSTKEMGYVIQNIEKQLQNSSISIRPLFLYINEDLKSKLREKRISIEELRDQLLFARLESFIAQIAEDYYDPEKEIPIEALKSSLENFKWNFEAGKIEVINNEDGMPFNINTLQELINYLEEEIIHALNGEMPLEWLKEQEDFDYEIVVREYLIDYYSNQIEKLGWNPNDL
jgi:hypothetical protein